VVYFTPPYHPELQPVELIWAHIKTQIAIDPVYDMLQLRRKIDAGFASLESSTWTKAYTHA
jgi:transposase